MSPKRNIHPSQFNRQDYHKLYDIASSSYHIRELLRASSYRDKRFQRRLDPLSEKYKVFYCKLGDVPMYLNSTSESAIAIALWRLELGK